MAVAIMYCTMNPASAAYTATTDDAGNIVVHDYSGLTDCSGGGTGSLFREWYIRLFLCDGTNCHISEAQRTTYPGGATWADLVRSNMMNLKPYLSLPAVLDESYASGLAGFGVSAESVTSASNADLASCMDHTSVPPSNTSCAAELTPASQTWSLPASGKGDTKVSTLHVSCTQPTDVTVLTNGSTSATGVSTLGQGVAVNWSWADGLVTHVNTDATSPLSLTANSSAAQPGQYNGQIIVSISYP